MSDVDEVIMALIVSSAGITESALSLFSYDAVMQLIEAQGLKFRGGLTRPEECAYTYLYARTHTHTHYANTVRPSVQT